MPRIFIRCRSRHCTARVFRKTRDWKTVHTDKLVLRRDALDRGWRLVEGDMYCPACLTEDGLLRVLSAADRDAWRLRDVVTDIDAHRRSVAQALRRTR